MVSVRSFEALPCGSVHLVTLTDETGCAAEFLSLGATVRAVRVAFNGTQTTDKPLVASLAIECGALVSILAADTRIVNGQTMGSMLLALPDTPAEAEKAIAYIRSYPGLTYEEVEA